MHWLTDVKYLLLIYVLWAQLVGFKGATCTPREPHGEELISTTYNICWVWSTPCHSTYKKLPDWQKCPMSETISPAVLTAELQSWETPLLKGQQFKCLQQCPSCITYVFPLSSLKHHLDRWQNLRTEIRVFFQGALGQHVQLSWHTTENPQVLQLASLTSQKVSEVSYWLAPSFKSNAKDEFGCLLFVVL